VEHKVRHNLDKHFCQPVARRNQLFIQSKFTVNDNSVRKITAKSDRTSRSQVQGDLRCSRRGDAVVAAAVPCPATSWLSGADYCPLTAGRRRRPTTAPTRRRGDGTGRQRHSASPTPPPPPPLQRRPQHCRVLELFIPGLNLPFLQILPTAAFPFLLHDRLRGFLRLLQFYCYF